MTGFVASIYQDESIKRANELRRRVWIKDGKMPLRKKGQGRAIHVSDFIVEEFGRLALSESQLAENNAMPPDKRLAVTDARQIIYPGKNYDGWWNGEKLIEQVSDRNLFTKWSLGDTILPDLHRSNIRLRSSNGCTPAQSGSLSLISHQRMVHSQKTRPG